MLIFDVDDRGEGLFDHGIDGGTAFCREHLGLANEAGRKRESDVLALCLCHVFSVARIYV